MYMRIYFQLTTRLLRENCAVMHRSIHVIQVIQDSAMDGIVFPWKCANCIVAIMTSLRVAQIREIAPFLSILLSIVGAISAILPWCLRSILHRFKSTLKKVCDGTDSFSHIIFGFSSLNIYCDIFPSTYSNLSIYPPIEKVENKKGNVKKVIGTTLYIV